MSSWPLPLLLLRRWLVDPPAISSFEWVPNKTFASSIPFLAGSILIYLSLTLLLHRRFLPLPSIPATSLRLLSSLHNVLLLLISTAMVLGCSLSAAVQFSSPRLLLCFPPSTAPRGPVFFWAQIFYLSKLYEFADTAIILLSGGRRLSFLHVYHHSVVVLMCYIWLAASQSLMPVSLVTNAGVHIVMYGYYLSASAGWRWGTRWKRAVTRLQISQFVLSFAASAIFLWLHFAGGGCEGMRGLLFNAAFNASLLALFVNFYSSTYGGRENEKKPE